MSDSAQESEEMPTTRELEERETIKEIMGAWEKYRALWVERFGNDEGFVDWFTETLSSVHK